MGRGKCVLFGMSVGLIDVCFLFDVDRMTTTILTNYPVRPLHTANHSPSLLENCN